MFTSGPPELPPKIGASWPIQRTIDPTSSPSSVIRLNGQNMPGMIISVLLTIPIVTDCDSASGLPSASTRSPTFSFETSPKLRRPGTSAASRGLSLRMAISDSGSVPTSSAGISSRVASVQMIARVRPATWWLVRTWPSAEMIVPLPAASRLISRPSWCSTLTTWIRTRLGDDLRERDVDRGGLRRGRRRAGARARAPARAERRPNGERQTAETGPAAARASADLSVERHGQQRRRRLASARPASPPAVTRTRPPDAARTAPPARRSPPASA